MNKAFGLLALVVTTASCGGRPSGSIRNMPSDLSSLTSIEDYQIGPEWGKVPVTEQYLASASPAMQRAARATASVRMGFGGATAFVLGEKDGVIRLGTNHHVIPNDAACRSASISFSMLKISGLKCDQLIGTWKDVDYSVFTLKGYNAEQKALLLSVARNFNFDAVPHKTQTLLTVGFGIASNPGQRNMMANADEDCKVYSKDGEVRYMKDPDDLNPSDYMTWAYATGCDVSHGDSGSAIVDRETGDVVGLLYTGRIPKDARARNRAWLDEQLATDSELIWKDLTFVVPTSKILEIAGNPL